MSPDLHHRLSNPSGTLKELLSEEVIFIARGGLAERFPPLTDLFKSPWLVHSASLEVGERTKEHLAHLTRMRTRCVDLVCKGDVSMLLDYAKELIDLSPSYLGVVVPDQLRADALAFLLEKHPLTAHISGIHIGSFLRLKKHVQARRQRTTRTEADSPAVVHNNRLVLSMDHFMEAHSSHTCFNGRIHVTAVGKVKYTLNEDTDLCTLEELANIAITKETWNMAYALLPRWGAKKDSTDVCMDCELRRICTDRRVPLEREDGTWHHAQECTYNPYICKWKGEEGYRTLAECGVISNADGFTIDHDRIAAINQELWGE